MSAATLRLSEDLSLPLDAVTNTFAILAKRGRGKTVTASVLTEELVGAGLPVCVLDPTGAWWGLRASADGQSAGLPVVIFGGEHADLPLVETAGAMLAEVIAEERFPAVLDLSLLTKSAARRFVTDFAESLYRRNREPLHLVIDECDLFMPQRTFAGTERLIGAMDDIVRRGRIKGLGVTLISQRPAVVNKDVLSQVECLIVLGMTGKHDIAAIDDWVRLHADEDDAKAVKASLPALPVGSAWVWSPEWLGVLQRVQVRMRHTFDSSATPKPGQKRVEPRRFADVDLDRLRERLEAAGPDVKAPTGASATKLQARIAELERQLAVKSQPVERTIEVPVVTAEQEAALVAAVVAYDAATRTLAEAIAAYGGAVATARPKLDPAAAPVPAPRQSVPAPATRARSVPAESNGTKFGRPERAVLVVLGQHPAGRTRTQLALLTGYSIKSSSLSNALGALRSAGLVTKGGEPIQATAEGIELAASFGDAEPLPTGRDLYEWWAGRLGRAERAVLDALVAAWPTELSKDEIATRTGYSATSSSLSNALGKLRSLDLVAGWAASDEFMEATREAAK